MISLDFIHTLSAWQCFVIVQPRWLIVHKLHFQKTDLLLKGLFLEQGAENKQQCNTRKLLINNQESDRTRSWLRIKHVWAVSVNTAHQWNVVKSYFCSDSVCVGLHRVSLTESSCIPQIEGWRGSYNGAKWTVQKARSTLLQGTVFHFWSLITTRKQFRWFQLTCGGLLQM